MRRGLTRMGMFDPPDPPLLPPLPLGIVLLSATYERAHYALMMATAAAAVGRPTVLFATMGGIAAFTRGGWQGLPGAEADATHQARGVAGFAELLAAAVELEVRLIVCEAGLKALAITADALDPDLPGEVAGLATFYDAVGDGSIVVV